MIRSAPRAPSGTRSLVAVLALLAAYVAVSFGDALRRPFFGDDFLFLERTRERSLISLWGLDGLAYHFYRPWSRELHFWWLQRLFGVEEPPFHLANLMLWLGVLGLYFVLVRRLLGTRVAGVAVAGLATLEAWAVPVPWASGSQDLWMLMGSLACLNAFVHGRLALAALALAVSLLSKETAAALPAIALLYAWLVKRHSPIEALRLTAPLWAVVLLWSALHPMLGGRLWRPEAPQLAFVGFRPLRTGIGSLLTLVNLERLPQPASGWVMAMARGLPAAGLLGLLLIAVGAAERPDHSGQRLAGGAVPESTPANRRRVLSFAAGWMLLAWLPTLMPVVAWQPYYALHGALGAWMVLAAGLARDRRVAVALVVALALLRSARLDTPSQDWASGWAQRQGAGIIGETRDFLAHSHPQLPAHSRLFFAAVPRGVALVSGPGDSPPLRVWYRDPTLQGWFYSQYRPRGAADPVGSDLFFRFDTKVGWIEILRGSEDIEAARQANPRWEHDHEVLARMLAETGDWAHAAVEFAKLAAAFPTRVEHAYNAGMSYESAGDSAAAALWYRRAASLPGADDEVRADSRRLAHLLPGPR